MTYSRAILVLLLFQLVKSNFSQENQDQDTSFFGPDKVCYDKFGCFGSESPWTSLLKRPLKSLPQSPENVGTRFLLYAKDKYETEPWELMLDKDLMLQMSPFNPSLNTIFLIHGFTNSFQSEWVVEAKNKLLNSEKQRNVIVIDWRLGAKGTYLKATGNARLAGRHIALFIQFLINKAKITADSVHIVGHGIAAHIAGYAGKDLNDTLGQITGLDPSGPYFQGTDQIVRLDKSDAKFVDVVHTDGDTLFSWGLGIYDEIGHVNIYPNGGKSQPGCTNYISSLVGTALSFITFDFKGVIDSWACCSVRANEYYVESIDSTCPFVAHKCKNYDTFEGGKCKTNCANEECTLMGYGSEEFSNARGNFYLHTQNKKDFCLQTVKVKAFIKSQQNTANGKLEIAFISNNGNSASKIEFFSGKMEGGKFTEKWLEIPKSLLSNPNEKPIIVVRYTRTGILYFLEPKELQVEKLTIEILDKNLEFQTVNYPETKLETGNDYILYPQ